ncbi:MAG: hypothetical protein KDC83_11410 [Flavobacteriales bacterium]|nr:hypothetical protein [Flavobacteriales bacterium]
MSFRILLYITLFTAVASCKKEDYEIVNLSGNKVLAYGHGGMRNSPLYPINSLESVSKCISLGADGVEVDIQMTADGEFVAYHDRFLSSLTNKSGKPHELTLSQVTSASYEYIPYTDYKIASLESILLLIAGREKRISLDCKAYIDDYSYAEKRVFFEKYATQLIKILDKYELNSKVTIETQAPELIEYLNSKSDYLIYYYPFSVAEAWSKNKNFEFDGISIDNEHISKEEVVEFHKKGLKVILWGTSSNKENEEAMRKSPDMIQSAKVKHLVKITR